ncbi:tyrosine-type recombinase/integrase [Tissierella carlieri]|uniref:tyrosine-type recombinase/integrase n=1 Tax=Tissierella carlieri TaxID=689904 RepID=UPI001C0F9FAC|nr:tyrosine-type recombinase/integrase [Tissierella carlieri]MBU5311043.1 tyrosine-type recombinase/integrase [Tissierella carlieri]
MKDFDYYVEDFMLYCTSKNLSKKTMKSYEQTLKLFQLYMEDEHEVKEVHEVDTKQIRQYIEYLKERGKYTVQVANADINKPHNRTDRNKPISVSTINNYIRNIKVFFNYLEEEKIIRDNPMDRIKQLKNVQEKKEPLTREDIRKMFKAFDITTFTGYRDFVITKLLLSTGARIGETLALNVDDVDLNNNTIIFKDTKNKKEKISYLNNKLSYELKKWIRYKDRYIDTDILFPTNRKNNISITGFESNLRTIGKNAGIENLHPHRLRYTFAVEFLKNGGNIYVLSKLFDHSSVQITEIYLNMDRDDIRREYMKHNPVDLIDF